MKLLSKLTQGGAVALMLTSLALSSGLAKAAGPGQIEGGNGNYTIANVTKGTGFANTQSADACDTVEYRLHLYNPGPSALSDVKVEATINTMTPYTKYVSTATAFSPDGITPQTNFQATLNISTAQTQSYVKDSTVLVDSAGNVLKSSANGTLADTVTMGSGGIDLGSLGESVDEYLNFKAQINCPTPPPNSPVYTCDALVVTAGDNRTVTISNFQTTAQNGATFKDAVVEWGDNGSQLTDSNIIGKTHQYSQDGSYTIAATAHFTVNGQDKTASGPQCEQVVTFKAGTPPTVTPPPTTPSSSTTTTPAAPTELVNTGAGNVLGLFVAVTAVGAIAYRRLLTRRLTQ